jgi:hypothetical protein
MTRGLRAFEAVAAARAAGIALALGPTPRRTDRGPGTRTENRCLDDDGSGVDHPPLVGGDPGLAGRYDRRRRRRRTDGQCGDRAGEHGRGNEQIEARSAPWGQVVIDQVEVQMVAATVVAAALGIAAAGVMVGAMRTAAVLAVAMAVVVVPAGMVDPLDGGAGFPQPMPMHDEAPPRGRAMMMAVRHHAGFEGGPEAAIERNADRLAPAERRHRLHEQEGDEQTAAQEVYRRSPTNDSDFSRREAGGPPWGSRRAGRLATPASQATV